MIEAIQNTIETLYRSHGVKLWVVVMQGEMHVYGRLGDYERVLTLSRILIRQPHYQGAQINDTVVNVAIDLINAKSGNEKGVCRVIEPIPQYFIDLERAAKIPRPGSVVAGPGFTGE